MFLAWWEKAADEKDRIVFQHRLEAHDGEMNHLAHFHNSVEFVFAVRNGFETYINETHYDVREGEICFVNSFEPHKYYYRKDNEFYVVVISANYFNTVNRLGDVVFSPVNPQNPGFEKIKEFLAFSYNNWEHSSPAYRYGFVNMLIGLMLRYYPTAPKPDRQSSSELMVNAVKYINENSRSPITIEELAERFGYTPNYFSNVFNRFMGVGFRDYLNWCRMLDYTRLLQEDPNLSAAQASELCGFGSVKSFYRARKKFCDIQKIPEFLLVPDKRNTEAT